MSRGCALSQKLKTALDAERGPGAAVAEWMRCEGLSSPEVNSTLVVGADGSAQRIDRIHLKYIGIHRGRPEKETAEIWTIHELAGCI